MWADIERFFKFDARLDIPDKHKAFIAANRFISQLRLYGYKIPKDKENEMALAGEFAKIFELSPGLRYLAYSNTLIPVIKFLLNYDFKPEAFDKAFPKLGWSPYTRFQPKSGKQFFDYMTDVLHLFKRVGVSYVLSNTMSSFLNFFNKMKKYNFDLSKM